MGLHDLAPSQCPSASKIGRVEVHTPLLNSPLKGWIYLATPHANPANALLGAYIVLEGHGIKVNLARQLLDPRANGSHHREVRRKPATPVRRPKSLFLRRPTGHATNARRLWHLSDLVGDHAVFGAGIGYAGRTEHELRNNCRRERW